MIKIALFGGNVKVLPYGNITLWLTLFMYIPLITMYDTESMYNELLDDIYGEIEICGTKWWASVALKRIDPIAYRCGLSDYESSLEEE